MEETTLPTQDIHYQPQTPSYTFSAEKPKNNNLKTNFVLFILIILVISILSSCILILNYFKVINLSKNFNNSPSELKLELFKITGSNAYKIEGKLVNFSNNKLTFKIDNNNSITIDYDNNSNFYSYKKVSNKLETDKAVNSNNSTPSADSIPTFEFPQNILNKNNIGKDMFIQFIIEKNKYKLQELDINE